MFGADKEMCQQDLKIVKIGVEMKYGYETVSADLYVCPQCVIQVIVR